MDKTMNIASFGGGTNSAAMIIGMIERGEPIDLILFADTGGEKPHTYEFVKIFNQFLNYKNYPEVITVKKVDKNGDVLTLEQDCLNGNRLPSLAYGFKTCSQKFKLQPQEKYCNNWKPAKDYWETGEKITRLIGFDAGEGHRTAKVYEDKKYINRYPLVEWGWDRDDCIEAIVKAGIPRPGKSACFFCPASRPSEIKALKYQYPDLSARSIAMEENADLHSIKGLGRSFSWATLSEQGDMFPKQYEEYFDFDPPISMEGCYDG